MTNTVTAFYSGKFKHPRYGTVTEVQQRLLTVDNNIFEQPDFITWLFPWVIATDDSKAPLLTSDDLEQFRQHYELRRLFNRSLQIILNYYGMQLRAETIQVSETFANVASLWLSNKDPTNMQRLTHIIHSITLLGEKHLAQNLVDILQRIQSAFPAQITDKQLQEWQQAIIEGEKQFYKAFAQAMHSYEQFWQQKTDADQIIPLKKLVFKKPENAALLITLISDKGFHPTHVSTQIYTLTAYSTEAHTTVYLTQGQLALCEMLTFQLPTKTEPVRGKDLVAQLLQ